MDFLENTVLSNGSYIGGDKLSVADIHVIWGIRWGLNAMDSNLPGLGASKESGLGKESFPKVWKLIEGLPLPTPKTLSAEEAIKTIEKSAAPKNPEGVISGDPTGIKPGTNVTIDSLE